MSKHALGKAETTLSIKPFVKKFGAKNIIIFLSFKYKPFKLNTPNQHFLHFVPHFRGYMKTDFSKSVKVLKTM